MAHTASMEAIQDFLAQKRIAMVGISSQPRDFSVDLFNELCRRGYDVVPVNPNASEAQGRRCFAHIQEIQPPVSAALLMTSPAATDDVVRDCAAAGIRRIWMYRAGNIGAVSEQAVRFCRDRGIEVIPGECPFMFLAGAAFYHRVHGLIRKLTGSYPRKSAA